MPIQLFIGFTAEGSTDTRFLTHIIQNVFEEIALECRTDVVIEDVVSVNVHKTEFTETMLRASKQAAECGLTVLCVHADADARSVENVMEYKFTPLAQALFSLSNESYCKAIVPVIPIKMTEAWMMADKELLKIKIAAKGLRDADLGLHRSPESYADPKQIIAEAIRIAQSNRTRRHRNELTISDLYAEMGQTISLQRLRELPSFCQFEENVRVALRSLGYID
ncbi:MAG: DUF4276 family protein [Paludibacter sp.]|nr:DUF4276 family protein [Paludibacter sp.]